MGKKQFSLQFPRGKSLSESLVGMATCGAKATCSNKDFSQETNGSQFRKSSVWGERSVLARYSIQRYVANVQFCRDTRETKHCSICLFGVWSFVSWRLLLVAKSRRRVLTQKKELLFHKTRNLGSGQLQEIQQLNNPQGYRCSPSVYSAFISVLQSSISTSQLLQLQELFLDNVISRREKHFLMCIVLLARNLFSRNPVAQFPSGPIGQEGVTYGCLNQSLITIHYLSQARDQFPEHVHMCLGRGTPKTGVFQQGRNDSMGMTIG